MMLCIQQVSFFSRCKLMQLYCLQERHSAQDLACVTQYRRDCWSTQENLCLIYTVHLDIKCLVSKHLMVVIPASPALGKSENGQA